MVRVMLREIESVIESVAVFTAVRVLGSVEDTVKEKVCDVVVVGDDELLREMEVEGDQDDDVDEECVEDGEKVKLGLSEPVGVADIVWLLERVVVAEVLTVVVMEREWVAEALPDSEGVTDAV
jgi:hypothetical protein